MFSASLLLDLDLSDLGEWSVDFLAIYLSKCPDFIVILLALLQAGVCDRFDFCALGASLVELLLAGTLDVYLISAGTGDLAPDDLSLAPLYILSLERRLSRLDADLNFG